MRDQKAFSEKLNNVYDLPGKNCLKEILLVAGHTDIFVRDNEISDEIDSFFWDVRSINPKGELVYFDVEVKTFWKNGAIIPSKIEKEGFSFPNRKSKGHNIAQSKTNWLVILSLDFRGAFFVSKDTFESKSVVRKDTCYKDDEPFRNILVSEGIRLFKKDSKWQIL